ncbi:MAG: hypothetical protein ACRDPV_12780, partial [Gaiellaceae bacterium]
MIVDELPADRGARAGGGHAELTNDPAKRRATSELDATQLLFLPGDQTGERSFAGLRVRFC